MQTHAEKLAKAREYKAANRERVLQKNREYNAARLADSEARAKKLAQDRESRKKNAAKRKEHDLARSKEKVRARAMVRERICRGTWKRMPCEICGDQKSHAHHDDYSTPLDVRWLCPKHHKEAHRAG